MFELSSPASPGVMIFPISLEDSMLYIMTSESAEDATINLRDKSTGVRLSLRLVGQHAALALIGKQKKTVLAKYGF
jgi:hypothetical protein